MKHYEDEVALDRAICSLPLEKPPAELRSAILASTIYRPVLAKPWELWVIGAALAVLAWLVGWIVLDGSAAVGTLNAIGFALLSFFRTPATLYWIALGGAIAAWYSQLNFMPAKRAARH